MEKTVIVPLDYCRECGGKGRLSWRDGEKFCSMECWACGGKGYTDYTEMLESEYYQKAKEEGLTS